VSGFDDPLAYPGTGNRVLVNKFDERDFGKLRQLEYAATLRRVAELQMRPVEGRFDLAHLQAIHRHVFQDVYAWAGELRQVNLAKGGSFFVDGDRLRSEGARVFGALAAEQLLRGLPKDAFVERLAVHYGAINDLHPFREGNGRATQTFLQQLARQAGYEIDYTKIDKARWNAAAAATHAGDFEPMRAVFGGAISPARAVAFDRLPTARAAGLFPELAGAFGVLRRVAHAAVERFQREDDRSRIVAEARDRLSRSLHRGEVPQGRAAAEREARAPGDPYTR
jgi:cell filamentation protein